MFVPPHHPYFDDRAAMLWHRSFDEAFAQAKQSGRRLLIVVTHDLDIAARLDRQIFVQDRTLREHEPCQN